MAHRALQRAGSGRPDLHVVAADEQFRGAGGRAVGGDIERPAAKPHRAAADLHRQHDGFADEAVHEGGRGIVVNISRRPDLFDTALVHDHHAVGDFERLFLVVGDEDRGDVDFRMQRAQPLPQFFAHLGVERAKRLVEQQDPRLDRKRAGQCDALTLATGQLAGIAVRQPVELHEIQQLLDAGADRGLVLADGARLHAQAEGDVFEHRHVAEQRVVLEHETDMALARAMAERVLAVDPHFPGVGPVEPGDDPQQRGLARTRRAEQRQQFALADFQIDIVERREGAEFLDDVFDFNGHAEFVLRPDAARERSSRPA